MRPPVLATFLVHPHNRVQAADCRRLLNGREPAKVSEISWHGPSTREEIRMLNRWVRTVTSTVGRGGHRVGQIIKTLLRPVRITAASRRGWWQDEGDEIADAVTRTGRYDGSAPDARRRPWMRR